MTTIPEAWLPPAKMQRIICHWTAGSHKANSTDKAHYHILIEGDGKLVRGNASITANQSPLASNYAAHTKNCNTGSIGISLCCMANAIESPFNPGPYPMQKVQAEVLIACLAQLCAAYDIIVSPKTVLTHAEVQPNLGITQNGKWDYTRLPFNSKLVGYKAIGDELRKRVLAYNAPTDPDDPDDNDNTDYATRPLGTVNTDDLNMREQPDADAKIVGTLDKPDKVEINRSVVNSEDGVETEWLSIIVMDTRQWAWVAARYIDRD